VVAAVVAVAAGEEAAEEVEAAAPMVL